jgi:hypothetical protein
MPQCLLLSVVGEIPHGRVVGFPDKYCGSEALGCIIAEVGPVVGSLPGQSFGGWIAVQARVSTQPLSRCSRLLSPRETRIEAECLWPRDTNFPEIRMARIEKEIRLPRHQHARHAKHRGVSREYPAIAYRLYGFGYRVGLPVLRQRGTIEVENERGIELHFKKHVFLQQRRRVEMDKHLENSQRLGFGYIHHWNSRAVPASAVEARSLSAEC